jgi:hypothetical protein
MSDSRSEDHDRIRSGASARTEPGHRRPHVEWKVAPERVPCDGQDSAIGAGVRHHEHEVLDGGIVPELPHDPSLDGLKVGQARLAFECVDAAMAITDGVPSPGIEATGERYFGPPPERRRQPLAQTPEQTDLSHVANGVGIRVEPQAGHETDRNAKSTELLEPNVLEDASFEPIDLARRDPDGPTGVSTAQSARDPCLAELLADGLRHLNREGHRAIEAAVSGRHRAMVVTGAHRWLS